MKRVSLCAQDIVFCMDSSRSRKKEMPPAFARFCMACCRRQVLCLPDRKGLFCHHPTEKSPHKSHLLFSPAYLLKRNAHFLLLQASGCRMSDTHRLLQWLPVLQMAPLQQAHRQELAVAISVLFELIIRYDGAVFADGFFQVCDIAPMFFTCFAAGFCFRI